MGLPCAVSCPRAVMGLSLAPPLLLPIPWWVQARAALSWAVEGRDVQGEWQQGQWSQVRQGFSVAPHVSTAFLHLPCSGALSGPLGAHNPPFCSRHFLEISPSSLWFIFCSDVCLPTQFPPTKKHKRKIGVNWGMEWPNWASCPSTTF